VPGQVWHLPNDPNTHTTRQLGDLVFQLAGQPRTQLRQVKPLLLRVAALTNRTLRRVLLEMQYQFAEPFIVDSSKIACWSGRSSVSKDNEREEIAVPPWPRRNPASTG
jgi:hypothetical protein